MAAAFLNALARLAARRPDRSTEITPPTGVANIGEIELVFVRLGPDPGFTMIKAYDDGRMAEIIVQEASEVRDAMDLVHMLIAHGVTAAKIIKRKPHTKSPPLRFVTQQVAGSHTIKEA
jgi:hypothetical protein